MAQGERVAQEGVSKGWGHSLRTGRLLLLRLRELKSLQEESLV